MAEPREKEIIIYQKEITDLWRMIGQCVYIYAKQSVQSMHNDRSSIRGIVPSFDDWVKSASLLRDNWR